MATTETFSFTGAVQTTTVPPGLTQVFAELWGPGGEDGQDGQHSGGAGGTGGRLDADVNVTGGETLNVYVGGGNGNRWGFNDGGAGGNGHSASIDAGDGGNGGGETSLRQSDDTELARAHAGGGGGGGGGEDIDGNGVNGGGGGGGAAGGSGGSTGTGDTATAGDDAEGTGDGGDGGSAGTGNGNPGSDGGQGVNGALATVVSQTTGGGNAGNGQLKITFDSNAPVNLTDTDKQNDTVTLDWDPATGDVESPNNYRVYRSTSSPVTTSDTLAGTPSGSSFQDTGLSADTTYHYAVSAVYPNGGEGDLSAEHSVTTLSAPPQNFTVTQGAEDELDLSWDAVSGATEYRIYRATSSGSVKGDYTQVATVSDPTTTYTDTGLDDGSTYFYRVTAFDGSNESGVSNEASATTVMPVPSGVSASLNATNPESAVDVSWVDESDSETGFEVASTRGENPETAPFTDPENPNNDFTDWTSETTTAADATSATVSGLNNGEKYGFAVRALGPDANSDWVMT